MPELKGTPPIRDPGVNSGQSVLSRVGKGLVSFGSGIPSAEIDTIRSNRDIAEDTARITEVQAQQAEAEEEQQVKMQELQQRAASGDFNAMEQLVGVNPEVAIDMLKAGGIVTVQQLDEAGRFAAGMLATSDPALQDQLIRDRIKSVTERGGNPKDTIELLDQTPEERLGALRVMQAATGTAQKQASVPTQKSTPRVVERPDGTKVIQTPVFDPNTGTVDLIETPFEGEVLSSLGETAADRELREIRTAAERKRAEEEAVTEAVPERAAAKTAAARRSTNITSALTAADTLPVLSRAIELLESVKTGGFAQAALQAKRITGTESADEAELSNSMGKAVLSQLRATFGAAFTAQEGQQLQAIEANFGKSTEGNKRLLQQTKRLVQRVVDRGIESAIENKDFGAADQIQKASEFSLSFDEPEQSAPTGEQGFDPSLLEFMTPEERALFE